VTLIGYVRVSTREQDYGLQVNALKAAGCEEVFSDTASGARRDRPGLKAALERVTAGDVLVVWKLDRLGRSFRDIINHVYDLGERGVHLRCQTQDFDTTTPMGRAIFHFFAIFTEVERDLDSERTREALAERRAKGLPIGRPPRLSAERVALAQRLRAEGQSVASIARLLEVSTDTIYKHAPLPQR
jgi:DNA invertase Pin-like site-specific DNA recombinase